MSTREDELLEQMSELASNLEAVMLENEVLTKVAISDHLPTVAMAAEIKRLAKEVASLRERNAGLQEEKNDAVRALVSAKKALKVKA